jgi:hypothetical protein
MSDVATYRDALAACITAARLLELHPIGDLLRDIDRAGSIGPIVDPTLYRDKARAMEEDRRVFESALPLWRLAQELRARAGVPGAAAPAAADGGCA